jgi:hypothetical protein
MTLVGGASAERDIGRPNKRATCTADQLPARAAEWDKVA